MQPLLGLWARPLTVFASGTHDCRTIQQAWLCEGTHLVVLYTCIFIKLVIVVRSNRWATLAQIADGVLIDESDKKVSGYILICSCRTGLAAPT